MTPFNLEVYVINPSQFKKLTTDPPNSYFYAITLQTLIFFQYLKTLNHLKNIEKRDGHRALENLVDVVVLLCAS